MRKRVLAAIGGMTMLVVLTGCNREEQREKKQAADARTAGFVPPSVYSRVDWGGSTERRFRELDHNADDIIEASELPRQGSKLTRFDLNKDGEITSSEWSEGTMNYFDAMDLNKDGTVTSEERQTAEQQGLVTPRQ